MMFQINESEKRRLKEDFALEIEHEGCGHITKVENPSYFDFTWNCLDCDLEIENEGEK